MKTQNKAFLYGSILLLALCGVTILIDNSNFAPFWGKSSTASIFFSFACWFLIVIGVQSFMYNQSMKRAKRDKEGRFNIWNEMSPAALRQLALAVFLVFAAIGPLGIFMRQLYGDISLFKVIFTTFFSGAFSAAIILFGKRPFLLMSSIVLFTFAMTYQRPLENYFSPVTHNQPKTTDTEIVLQKADVERYNDQRTALGIFTIALIVSGYIVFIFVIGGEGKKRVQLETEITVARKIQQELLPKCVFQRGNLQIQGQMIPAKEVGGDYYDCFSLPNNEHLVVLADASGHGVGAGILSAMMKSALTGFLQEETTLTGLFDKLNRTMCQITGKSQFITAAAIRLNPTEHTAEIITAGHHPVLHVKNASIEQIRTPSLALGLQKTAVYQSTMAPFTDGDTFLIYSDGITEATNKQGEAYTASRLEKTIRRSLSNQSRDISEFILTDAVEFSTRSHPEDDMTVMVVRT